ncbi:Ppx/GppA phosphatase family protein [Tatumella sp. UBA2305]|uniref:Ppx/GppA phosphatase family protein n=1 Tax=Tatumella sp. UBA2305 TaxID=1947647 RepID=UPI0025FA0855|nr:phosphatase [Tatumella sp. UBA2305]
MSVYRKMTLFCLTTLIAMFTLPVYAGCLQTRAALDIGSGSSKIAVADVDICRHQIMKMRYQQQIAIPYNDALMHADDNRLPQAVIQQGLSALQTEMKNIRRFHPVSVSGVATAVFRSAKNGPQTIDWLNQQTGAGIKIISQQQEALLGFASAKASLHQPDIRDEDILVWDIGGASMQMTTWTEEQGKKVPYIYQGKLASVTLKNYIVSLLKNQPLTADSSPNPVGNYADSALKFVRFYASNDVDSAMKRMISGKKVLGIGGVHDYSLRDQLPGKPNSYTLQQLTSLAKQQVNKDDSQLKGDYRATDVSNLLLVQGYMQALQIPAVTIVRAGLVEGELVR